MSLTYEFKKQFAFSLADSADKVAEEVLAWYFGRVKPRHIRVKAESVGAISAEILAPDRSTIIKCRIIFDIGAKPVSHEAREQCFSFLYNTTTLITPSDAFSVWILSRIAEQQNERAPGIRNRYEIATKNLKGLKRKSQIFTIFSIVFCAYFTIAGTASVGAALTNSSSLKTYGLPTFVALTAVFAALAIAFAVATFCIHKEKRKADVALSCIHSELLALHDVSVAELGQLCNKYLHERGMEIELCEPITERGTPPEITSVLSQQNETEYRKFC